ncbi:hypothetical protein RB195_017315 [Necator americanus]|uniref:Uncharacterized protein n=1 Tax=Necator americanus TaxID=51031 RepID=A0ABR1C4N4_NECAM
MDTYERLEVPAGDLPPPPPSFRPVPASPKPAPLKDAQSKDAPSKERKSAQPAAKPVRSSDDINVGSDEQKKSQEKKEGASAPAKEAPPPKGQVNPGNKKGRPLGGKTPKTGSESSSKSAQNMRKILLVSILIVLFFCVMFFIMTIIGFLHLLGIMKFINSLRPVKCV